jgi:HD superfamily phosphohydrolase
VGERMYRDPVHNIIAVSDETPTDRLIIALVDSPEFQRLRRIRQLGLALYTYQGAEHSRFTHSLGVMHLMTRALRRLRRDFEISEEAWCVGRCAALLHDVGHGPFSHVIEKVLGYTHERRTLDILLDPRTHIHRALQAHDPALPALIGSVYDYTFRPEFVCQLVSSQLDVDRCDYLLRDALMTGAKYGNYDLEWILSHLRVDPSDHRLYVRREGVFAVEEYLQARYYMFRQVYFHRALRSAESILISIMRRAVELHAAGRLQFYIPDSVFERVLRRETLDVPEYLRFDDHDMMFHIKQWTDEPDRVLSDLCTRFYDRRLFKAVDLEFAGAPEEAFVAQVRGLVEAAGFDPEFYFVVDSASDIPYYGYYAPDASAAKANIYVETRGQSREIREISEVSHVVRGLRSYRVHRVYFPEEVRDEVMSLAAEFAPRQDDGDGA